MKEYTKEELDLIEKFLREQCNGDKLPLRVVKEHRGKLITKNLKEKYLGKFITVRLDNNQVFTGVVDDICFYTEQKLRISSYYYVLFTSTLPEYRFVNSKSYYNLYLNMDNQDLIQVISQGEFDQYIYIRFSSYQSRIIIKNRRQILL